MVPCPFPPEAVTSEKVIVGVASQISVAVAVPVPGGSVPEAHMTVRLGGQVIVGGVLSSTEIFCTQVLELLQSSVAFQVRLMVFSWGQVPPIVMSVKVMVGVGSHISVAVADPVVVGAVLVVQPMVTLIGHVITGGTLSVRVIICVQQAELPLSSVAFQVRLILYPNPQSLDATVTSVCVMVGVASQKSVAVAVPVLAGSVLPVQETVTFPGQDMIGGVLSFTITLYWQMRVLPQGSVAFMVMRVVPTPRLTDCPGE